MLSLITWEMPIKMRYSFPIRLGKNLKASVKMYKNCFFHCMADGSMLCPTLEGKSLTTKNHILWVILCLILCSNEMHICTR